MCSTPGCIPRDAPSTSCRAMAGPGLAGDRHWASAYRVDPASGELLAAGRAGGAAVAPPARLGRPQRPVSADRLQQSEQRHGAPPRRRRRHRRRGGSTGQARHRHLCASGAHHAGQSHRDPGGARQPCGRRQGGGSRRAEALRLRRWRADRPGFDRAGRRLRLRTAPHRFPSDAAVGLRLDRAAEPAGGLCAQRRRHARPRSAVHQGHAARTRARQARRSRPDRSMSIRTAASST